MWVFQNNSMLSIVADRNDPARLLVRARIRGDIERVFPEAEVLEIAGDYAFRAFLPRERVSAKLAEQVKEINYPNFKSSVHEHERHKAYMAVWAVMERLQARLWG